MRSHYKTFYLILLLIIIYELIQGAIRHKNRCIIYNKAIEKSKQTGKKVIIVGDPHNGTGTNIYKYIFGLCYQVNNNNLMIDLYPCDKCIDNQNTIKGDLSESLKQFKDDCCIIFVSCTLEYIKDIEEAIKEIYRVAGSSDNIFINHIQPYTLSSFFYIRNKDNIFNRIFEAPPFSKCIKYQKL